MSARSNEIGASAKVTSKSGVDGGLSQLSNASGGSSASVSSGASNDDRKRRHKEAAKRVYNKPITQAVREVREATAKDVAPKATTESVKVVVPSTITDNPWKGVGEKAPWSIADGRRTKIFLQTPRHLLPGGSKWWRWFVVHKATGWLIILCVATWFMFSTTLLILHGYGAMLMKGYFAVCALVCVYLLWRLVERYYRKDKAPTGEWVRGQGDATIFAFDELEHAENVNVGEFNVMATYGFNSYRHGTFSQEAVDWLESEKTPKPTQFTQQQFADAVVKQFKNRAPREWLLNSAAFHHQTLLADFYRMKMQCGDVADSLERI